jgi:DNA repair exonuclease SbcCD nuclease subunit
MKIAVISDSHLGFGYGSEKEQDSFRQFDEALEKAIQGKVDMILLPGDIFDSRIPRQEVWAKVLAIFQKPLLAGKSGVTLVQKINKQEISPMALSGIPIVAIHGTHERRGTDSVNPVEMLEKAGFLIHLHASGVVFEKNGERVCIQGISGVPENRAKEEFKKIRMLPAQGCKNIFLFHQSLAGQVYSDDEQAVLAPDDLPAGFDLYIDGHIHASALLHGPKKILLPGSTIITQQKKNEAELRKGFYIVDTNGWVMDFRQLETQRDFHYIELGFQKASVQSVVQKAREKIQQALGKPHKMKPLIFVKLNGDLEQGKEASNVREEEITKGFNAMITVSNDLYAEDFRKKIERLREKQQKRMSVDEIGLDLLRKTLAGTKAEKLPLDSLISELAEGNTDSVVKKTLDRRGQS